MRRMLALVLLVLATALCARVVPLKPLTAAGVAALLHATPEHVRVVMLWSLECRYCEPNMHALAKLQRAHSSRVALVTVATDPIVERKRILARLADAGMRGYAAYAYVAPTPGRLNFRIDPNWGGELPRTIVIHADGSRTAMSGLLTPKQLRNIAP